jgi:hypothetical protein
MTPLDLALSVAGRLAAAVKRWTGGSRRATWGVVSVLLLVSAIPTLLIATSQRPTDLTFDDVRFGHIPAMTTWVRLEGDLKADPRSDGFYYRLHDRRDPRLYVIVAAPSPLPLGPTVVTGRLSQGVNSVGNIGTIEVDVPAVPRRDEPFQLILIPALLGIVLAVGLHVGYPVVRRDRPSPTRPGRLARGEGIPADWSGRIGSDVVTRDNPRACTVEVAHERDLHVISLTVAGVERTVRMRRSAPVTLVRLCRTMGCRRGVEIHARADDLIISFDDRTARDRFAATLE